MAALNKVELLPWDGWGLIDRSEDSLTSDDYALLDWAAAVAAEGGDEICTLYQGSVDLKVPSVIRSYTGPQPIEVNLEF